MIWNESAKKTESGAVSFHYTLLSQLKNEISPEPLRQLELSKKVKMISVSKEYETDIEFSEADEKKKSVTYFILEKTGNNKTNLTIRFYLKKNPAMQITTKSCWIGERN